MSHTTFAMSVLIFVALAILSHPFAARPSLVDGFPLNFRPKIHRLTTRFSSPPPRTAFSRGKWGRFGDLDLDLDLDIDIDIDIDASTAVAAASFPSRRDAVGTLSLGFATLLAARGDWAGSESAGTASIVSSSIEPLRNVDDALRIIDDQCDRTYLHAVISSDYRFLYRGVDGVSSSRPSIRQDPPDLLDPVTYGASEPDAAAYFTDLNRFMSKRGDPITPGNGHLATTSVDDAAAWGQAVSVWPLSTDAHFAWYADGGTFWPNHGVSSSSSANKKLVGDIIVDGVDCGKMNLADALEGEGFEVMFRAERFLTIPMSMEKDLRDGLKRSFFI